MGDDKVSYRARKALMVHIGEEAGSEIADLISRLVTEVEELRRTKVDVTQIAPTTNGHGNLIDDAS